MDVTDASITEDISSFEKNDDELSGRSGARISPRLCATGLPHLIPSKPQHKDSCAGLVVDHFLLDQVTIAKEFCVSGTNSQTVTLQTSVVKKGNSLLENSSENVRPEEIIPSVSAIILALEQEKLKQELTGKLDKKSGHELMTTGRPSRCQLRLNLKCDGLRPVPNKKSADKKIPPQVPPKPFKHEQRKLLLISNSSGKRNSFTKENDGSVCCSPNHGSLSREVCLEKLPSPYQLAVRSPEHGPECWPPFPACNRVQRSSSSASSSVDGHSNAIDVQPVDAEMRTVISITAVDVESSQTFSETQSSRLTLVTSSPVPVHGHHVTRRKESARPRDVAFRRSRSVEVPASCRKSFSKHTAQLANAPTNPQSHTDNQLNSSTVFVSLPDSHLVEGTCAQISQSDCLVLEWTGAFQDDKMFECSQPLTKESKYDVKCKSADAIAMTFATDTSNGTDVSMVEMFYVQRPEMQGISNEVMVEVLVAATDSQKTCKSDSVGILFSSQRDSDIANSSERQERDLEVSFAKVCTDEQEILNSSQFGSVNFDSVPRNSSPDVMVTSSAFVESAKCVTSLGCSNSFGEISQRQSDVQPARNQSREDEPSQFCLFSNTPSLADEIFKTLSYDSGSSNSSLQPLFSETSGYGSVNSAGSSSDSFPLQRRSSDILDMAGTLSAAIDNIQEEMKNMWDDGICDKNDVGDNLGSLKCLRRKPSNHFNEAQKKSNNRKVSKAKSFKQWKRYTQKVLHPLSAKSSERSNDNDTFDSFYKKCADDDENSCSGSESDGIDTDFDENTSHLIIKKDAERTRHQRVRSAHHVASELLATERNYVRKLHLIDQVFQSQIIDKNHKEQMFNVDVIPQMFSNIKSIYSFHHDFVLPQLEDRMKNWESIPRIGDVMKKFAPFLKLYTDYIKNFDTATTTINYWLERSVKFRRAIHEIQRMPECGHLNLQHHMLEPIQRVPRYQLLLKDYLRLLPPNSADRPDATDALELVTQAAQHSNEVMRKTEKFNKLVEISECLGGITNLVCPTRELVKEGKLVKISARDGSHRERYLFLFSDLLLICHLPLNIGQRQQYRMRTRMDFDGMETIIEGCNLETANTFYVNGKERSFEFHASSLEEKNDWMKTFKRVIAQFQQSFQNGMMSDSELGRRAPIWVKDPETSMCMCCSVPFTPFRRRHHCRACGDVICGKCSSKRAVLAYNGNQEKRVCDPCFCKLGDTRKNSSESVSTISSSEEQVCRKGILQVRAREPAVLSGYLNMGCNKKNLNRRFFAVHEDFVLYSFKAHQDVVAMTSLPLPGYMVAHDDADERGFKVFHAQEKKTYYFQTEDVTSRNRWVEALQEVVQLRLPKIRMNVPGSPL